MYMRGETEVVMGDILAGDDALRNAVRVATKANAFKGYDETLSAKSVATQMVKSTKALKADAVDIYYLHNPDPKVPILETLRAVDELHKAGKFNELGLSNFAAWEVCHIVHLCKEHGFVAPSVYQGMYNAITRDVERELLPCLKALGLRFNAYNPLCGGLLACTRTREELATLDDGSRFRKSNKMYRDRYLSEPQLDAVDAFRDACAGAGVKPVHAALRWMKHHSTLKPDDGIIVGASKVAHLEDNLDGLDGGPLPEAVVAACDAGWGLVKGSGIVPSYERGTSLYE
mmetsp:Transcript_25625/g.77247  ORF Transcript_25625/g.77247 Transcript_25625/m.77247 type:complete len:287 (+) Transcript_25625:82-942(+)